MNNATDKIIEDAILEVFEREAHGFATSIKRLWGLKTPKSAVILALSAMEKSSPLIYQSALMYVDRLWEQK